MSEAVAPASFAAGSGVWTRWLAAMSWRRAAEAALPWVVPVALVLVWQIAADQGWISRRTLPSPSSILTAGMTLARSGELQQHVLTSCRRAFLGFAIGGGIGLALGLLNGLSRPAEKLLDTTLQMLRNVPHLAIIPMVILWFGIEESAKIFILDELLT